MEIDSSVLLLGKSLAGLHNTDAMVSEVGVHLRDIDLFHMAVCAVTYSFRARRARMTDGCLLFRLDYVATAAYVVVGRRIGFKLLVRVVARGACQARVAVAPALAGDETVWGGPCCGYAFRSRELCIPKCTVAGTAKVHRILRRQAFRIVDFLLCTPGLVRNAGVHRLRMVCTRAMASLACDPWDQTLLIELSTCVGCRGMASETLLNLGTANGPVHCLCKAGWGQKGAPGSEVKRFQPGEEGDPCLVKAAVFLFEQIRLGDTARSKGPRKRIRDALISIRDRICGPVRICIDSVLEFAHGERQGGIRDGGYPQPQPA